MPTYNKYSCHPLLRHVIEACNARSNRNGNGDGMVTPKIPSPVDFQKSTPSDDLGLVIDNDTLNIMNDIAMATMTHEGEKDKDIEFRRDSPPTTKDTKSVPVDEAKDVRDNIDDEEEDKMSISDQDGDGDVDVNDGNSMRDDFAKKIADLEWSSREAVKIRLKNLFESNVPPHMKVDGDGTTPGQTNYFRHIFKEYVGTDEDFNFILDCIESFQKYRLALVLCNLGTGTTQGVENATATGDRTKLVQLLSMHRPLVLWKRLCEKIYNAFFPDIERDPFYRYYWNYNMQQRSSSFKTQTDVTTTTATTSILKDDYATPISFDTVEDWIEHGHLLSESIIESRTNKIDMTPCIPNLERQRSLMTLPNNTLVPIIVQMAPLRRADLPPPTRHKTHGSGSSTDKATAMAGAASTKTARKRKVHDHTNNNTAQTGEAKIGAELGVAMDTKTVHTKRKTGAGSRNIEELIRVATTHIRPIWTQYGDLTTYHQLLYFFATLNFMSIVPTAAAATATTTNEHRLVESEGDKHDNHSQSASQSHNPPVRCFLTGHEIDFNRDMTSSSILYRMESAPRLVTTLDCIREDSRRDGMNENGDAAGKIVKNTISVAKINLFRVIGSSFLYHKERNTKIAEAFAKKFMLLRPSSTTTTTTTATNHHSMNIIKPVSDHGDTKTKPTKNVNPPVDPPLKAGREHDIAEDDMDLYESLFAGTLPTIQDSVGSDNVKLDDVVRRNNDEPEQQSNDEKGKKFSPIWVDDSDEDGEIRHENTDHQDSIDQDDDNAEDEEEVVSHSGEEYDDDDEENQSSDRSDYGSKRPRKNLSSGRKSSLILDDVSVSGSRSEDEEEGEDEYSMDSFIVDDDDDNISEDDVDDLDRIEADFYEEEKNIRKRKKIAKAKATLKKYGKDNDSDIEEEEEGKLKRNKKLKKRKCLSHENEDNNEQFSNSNKKRRKLTLSSRRIAEDDEEDDEDCQNVDDILEDEEEKMDQDEQNKRSSSPVDKKHKRNK